MRKTRAAISVALAVNSDPHAPHWGYQLIRKTNVKSGTLYPILQSMCNLGWLTMSWEHDNDAEWSGRPRRRYYHLTDTGRAELTALLAAARHEKRFADLWPAGSSQPSPETVRNCAPTDDNSLTDSACRRAASNAARSAPAGSSSETA